MALCKTCSASVQGSVSETAEQTLKVLAQRNSAFRHPAGTICKKHFAAAGMWPPAAFSNPQLSLFLELLVFWSCRKHHLKPKWSVMWDGTNNYPHKVMKVYCGNRYHTFFPPEISILAQRPVNILAAPVDFKGFWAQSHLAVAKKIKKINLNKASEPEQWTLIFVNSKMLLPAEVHVQCSGLKLIGSHSSKCYMAIDATWNYLAVASYLMYMYGFATCTSAGTPGRNILLLTKKSIFRPCDTVQIYLPYFFATAKKLVPQTFEIYKMLTGLWASIKNSEKSTISVSAIYFACAIVCTISHN